MRWMLAIVIATAGCPRSPAVLETPDAASDAPSVEPRPESNCSRGPAPPVAWCREHRTGYAVSEDSLSSSGSLYVDDWTNITDGGHGHSETTYGEGGIWIERVATGTFAGYMYATCDDEGRVELDRSATGTTERTRYDLAGHALSFEWDRDGDGDFEDRHRYRYDAHGGFAHEEHDTGIGTPIDSVTTYTSDELGHMLSAITDLGADGTIDRTMRNTWDELGQEIEQTVFDGDGELTARWTFTYDGPRLVQTEIAGDYRWTNHYAADRLIATDYFDVKANHLDARSAQTYDALGRQIEYAEDDGVDGTVDERVRWEYCP